MLQTSYSAALSLLSFIFPLESRLLSFLADQLDIYATFYLESIKTKKRVRNSWKEYFSAKSGELKLAHSTLGPGCSQTSKCELRKLFCQQILTEQRTKISKEQRMKISNRQYDLPSLDEKRKYLHARMCCREHLRKSMVRKETRHLPTL